MFDHHIQLLNRILQGQSALAGQISQLEKLVAKTKADLDAAITAQTAAIQQLTTAVTANVAADQALLAAIAANGTQDFSDEVAALSTANAELKQASDNLAAQTTADTLPTPTPVPPAPTPTPTT